jgi:pyruvate/2-oxoacid:ferredoxin oxidoreductase beta subunit
MASLLDNRRPPAFCPGCCHERVVGALDQALGLQSLAGHQVALVSDIGCSGLFDTFFRTHALHGLHGRALTYATGLKLARPELHVVVTMGDGGLGIGGAHLLAASRRNLDMTLLVLNNFNFGMTGGQCSVTTPSSAEVSSGFLNRLEPPLDVCRVAAAAGAPHVRRLSAYDRDLPAQIAAALRFAGFAVLDIRGVCPGRYTRRNRLTPEQIASEIAGLPALAELEAANAREEYGRQYRRMAAAAAPPARPVTVAARQSFALARRRETVILGSAGQRVVTAGELLGLAAMSAGLHATQKSDYDITVLRGPSITEVILSPEPVGFTGLEQPDAVLALSQEAVERRRPLFAQLRPEAQVVAAGSVSLPASAARVQRVPTSPWRGWPGWRAAACC